MGFGGFSGFNAGYNVSGLEMGLGVNEVNGLVRLAVFIGLEVVYDS